MNSPILVSGAGRSGSNMVAGVLRICGAFSGTVDEQNENILIKEKVVTPYLTGLGADPTGQYPLLDTSKIVIPVGWANSILSIIISDGYQSGPWMYKSPRSILLWPVWFYAFPNAKWLLVRRRTGDIIRSCSQTAYMSAFSSPIVRKNVGVANEEEGWRWWVHQYEERMVAMIMDGLNCRVIWPERMVSGDYQQIMETIEWLGLSWKSEVLSYIDPRLWKARKRLRDPMQVEVGI